MSAEDRTVKRFRLLYAEPYALRWNNRAYCSRAARDAAATALRNAGATVRTWDIRRLP